MLPTLNPINSQATLTAAISSASETIRDRFLMAGVHPMQSVPSASVQIAHCSVSRYVKVSLAALQQESHSFTPALQKELGLQARDLLAIKNYCDLARQDMPTLERAAWILANQGQDDATDNTNPLLSVVPTEMPLTSPELDSFLNLYESFGLSHLVGAALILAGGTDIPRLPPIPDQ